MASRKRRYTAAEAAEMLFEESSLDTDNDTDIDDSNDDSDVLYEIGDIAMSSDENDSDNNDNGDDDGADESESESATVGEQWTKWQSTHVMNQLPFTVQNPGVQIIGTAIPDNAGDSFALFFTTDFVQEMVNETNRYANEKLSNLVGSCGCKQFYYFQPNTPGQSNGSY